MRACIPLPLLVLALLASACGRCDDTPEAREEPSINGLTAAQRREVLARVGDEEITLGDFADRLAEQSPYLRARYGTPERRRELLESMIRFELLAQEAERAGYGNEAEVQRAESRALVQALLEREIDARLRPSDITDADVETYYRAHPEEFDQPEQVRASHIRTADRASAQRVLTQVLAAPGDDALFARLARELSNDAATSGSGGDLRFFSRPEGETRAEGAPPVALAEAAFSLERVGEVHPRVVQSEDGFHVVKLVARRQALHRTLDEVRRPVQNRLYRERREAMQQALVERLRREASVVEDEAALASIRVTDEAPSETNGEARQ